MPNNHAFVIHCSKVNKILFDTVCKEIYYQHYPEREGMASQNEILTSLIKYYCGSAYSDYVLKIKNESHNHINKR